MALNYDITTSTNSADVIIRNIYTLGITNLTLRIFLNNGFVEWVENIDTTWLVDYTYTYTGLSSNTTYSFEIEFWDYRTLVDSISGSFTTNSGGGGGSGEPHFLAYATNNNSDIYVYAYDLRYVDYDYVVYTISNGSYSDSYSGVGSYTFEGVPSGTYTVEANYRYNNRYYQIYTENGQSSVTVVIGGGGGGGNWSYRNVSPISISSSTVSWATGYALIGQEGLLFTFNSTQNGTLDIFSTYPSGGPLKSYIGNVDNGYDPSNGIPYSYNDYNTGSFSYSINVINNGTYYLWVTSANDSAFTLNLNFISTAIAPTYSASVNSNNITFNVSNRGNYYLRYFVRLYSDPNDETYDSYPYQTVTTKTISNLNYSTTYAVNVGYSEYNTGNVTWIGSQILQTGGSSGFTYTLVSGVIASTSTTTKSISFAQNTGWIVPITINQAGRLTLYTQTNQSSVMDDIGYLASSSNEAYDSSTGALYSYITYNDDSHGNGEFSIVWPTVASGNYLAAGTYYLYIQGYDERAITTVLYVTFTPATSPNNNYVYIFNGSQWKKAVPYIFNGSQWKEAQVYIFNGSQWKKCGQ